MISRKHLLLAIAATCLLTMFVITVVPIRSQAAGHYDPWLDVNDDGKMDGKDIALTALAFGTAGDPTKNVTVTNLPLDDSGNIRVNATQNSPTWHNTTYNYDIIDSVPSLTMVGGNPWFGGGVQVVSDTQFDFQPTNQPYQIADLWVTGTFGPLQQGQSNAISRLGINGLPVQGDISTDGLPTYFSVHVQNSTVLQSVKIGTNLLSFGQPSNGAPLFWKLMIHITYAYLE